MHRILVLTIPMLLTGCVRDRTLVPAPAAEHAPGAGRGAVAAAQGVAVEVRVGTWEGFPSDLDEVQPLLVSLRNESEHPVLVRYEYLQLLTEPGSAAYRAIPPIRLDQTEVVPVTLDPPPYGFEVAPYASPWYPGVATWAGPWDVDPYYDPYFADAWGPEYARVELPTVDMLERALPEGVLLPGGELSGYVYLPELGADLEQVTFTMPLVDAVSRERFGVVSIPFRVVPEREAVALAD